MKFCYNEFFFQFLKFIEVEMGLCKMFYFQMRVFETIITVSSGHSALYHAFIKSINLSIKNLAALKCLLNLGLYIYK